MSADVVVLDYGSGNVHSGVRALEHVGARVELTADPGRALSCDGLFVPGVGNFHACMAGLRERRQAAVVPHMGWSQVEVGPGSRLFAGVESARFYFVHSYAAHDWTLVPSGPRFEAVAPIVTHARHGERFVAAVENGPLAATQFHPEKSGDAGLTLLENWVRGLT